MNKKKMHPKKKKKQLKTYLPSNSNLSLKIMRFVYVYTIIIYLNTITDTKEKWKKRKKIKMIERNDFTTSFDCEALLGANWLPDIQKLDNRSSPVISLTISREGYRFNLYVLMLRDKYTFIWSLSSHKK